MATAYSVRDWTALFAASAGASAALTGLLFVAVSVNIERILEVTGLPERALQTLLMLLSAVIISLVVLIPGQSAAALGVELLTAGVASGVALGRLLLMTEPALRQYAPTGWQVAIVLPGTLLFVVGALSLLARTGGGLYWVVGGIIGSIVGASANAWVLLVEILR